MAQPQITEIKEKDPISIQNLPKPVLILDESKDKMKPARSRYHAGMS